MTTSTRPTSSRRPVKPGNATSEQPIKLLLVDFRNGESVGAHPDVAPLLRDGWSIRSAVPRIVEEEGTRLFVVLTRRKTTKTFALAASTAMPAGLKPTVESSRPA